MDVRFAAICLGCAALVAGSAGIASQYIWPAPAAADRPAPAFAMTAQQTHSAAFASWPPSHAAVAFNDDMIALLTMGANAASRAHAEPQQQQQQQIYAQDEPRRLTRRELREERRRLQREDWERRREEWARQRDERKQARGNGTGGETEIVVRDSRGRIVRIERVEREAYDARAQAPRQGEPRKSEPRRSERREVEAPPPPAYAPGPRPFPMFGIFGIR